MNFNKNGFLYKAMKKYRLKYTVICIVCIVLFAMYTSSCINYLMAKAFGPSALDVEMFATESGSMVLDNGYSYDKNSPDARIFGFASPETSYMQGGAFRFDVKIDDIIPADFAYTMSGVRYTEDIDTDEDPIATKADYAIIGGKTVILLMMPEQNIAPGDTVTGIFTQNSPVILAEMAGDCPEGGREICPYMLDVRGIEMGSEFSDTLIWVVFLIILLVLLTKLAIYYIRPAKHPIYTQLDKYGDIYAVAQDIEKELEDSNTQYYKNEIYTPEWILTKQTFKYKIGKNHTAGGKFKYTP